MLNFHEIGSFQLYKSISQKLLIIALYNFDQRVPNSILNKMMLSYVILIQYLGRIASEGSNVTLIGKIT